MTFAVDSECLEGVSEAHGTRLRRKGKSVECWPHTCESRLKGSTKFQLRHGRLETGRQWRRRSIVTCRWMQQEQRGLATLLARLIFCCAPGLPFAVVSDTPSVIYHEKLPLTSSPSRRSVFQVTGCPGWN